MCMKSTMANRNADRVLGSWFAQDSAVWFFWCMSSLHVGVSFWLSVMYIDYLRLFTVDRARGGAVWRPRGGQCGANVGALDFAVCAPEGVPEE